MTWRYLLDTAISSKKGNFNTPSVFSLLKKKTAALIVISKPLLGCFYSVRRVKILPPNNGFFYFPLGGFYFYVLFDYFRTIITIDF